MNPGSLYNHMRRHKGEPSFMCRFCAKLFLTAGQLKVHERIHTKEKAFVCNVGKGGKQNSVSEYLSTVFFQALL